MASLIPSENSDLFVKQTVRSENFQRRWRETDVNNNPYNTQAMRKSLDPVEQELLPFAGRMVDGRLYQSRDPYHWRQYMGLPVAESEFLRMRLVTEGTHAQELLGDDAQVTRFWKNRADNWHC